MTDRHTKLVTMKLLRGALTYEQAQRAIADPETYKAEEKRKSLLQNRADGKQWPGRYRWGYGKVKTSRMIVAYCWMLKRNKAGYFLGWREVYDAKGKIIKRDQFVSRKTKRRLAELQKRRTDDLVKAGALYIR